jgi:hypothetical protein
MSVPSRRETKTLCRSKSDRFEKYTSARSFCSSGPIVVHFRPIHGGSLPFPEPSGEGAWR